MKILVTAKRVPDPEQKVKFKGNELDQSATNWQLNQFDEYAVETALRLTENASAGNARDGEVTVVSIGPKETSAQAGEDLPVILRPPSYVPSNVALALPKVWGTTDFAKVAPSMT